ncbi:unnamed protein product [Rotaria sordida]|uniref:Uncharacterized protein n=1 Tax=Rotaria sordida TaxID=392033 RepID=A0A814YRH6_9BILA|nr:unnamed protein product [Rotaria sordida]
MDTQLYIHISPKFRTLRQGYLGSASGLTCYFCANCPVPFNPYASSVREVPSNSGYCAKKSTSSQPGALAT